MGAKDKKTEKTIAETDVQTNRPSARNVSFSSPDRNYDTMDAEETIRAFGAFLRNVITHYEQNQRLQQEAEAQQMDLNHCIEMMDDVNGEEMEQLYRKLAIALQTRRACKMENQILQPLYTFISDKVLIGKLGQVQGAIGTVKDVISGRAYACRTDVLDDFRMEDAAEAQAEPVADEDDCAFDQEDNAE